MFIAVASRDGKSVTGHIGKCADWILFEVTPPEQADAEPVVTEQERITLPKELVFHHYRDEQPHPLKRCVAVIGASAGESFVSKMAGRGIEVVLTAEADPATAAASYARDNVLPPRPRPIGRLVCKIRDALSSD